MSTLSKMLNPILAIASRDLTKLLRDRMRIASNFIFPAIFIGVLGGSLQSNLNEPYNFLTFVFIGVIAQTLFQSTASGLISLVEDRQTDFSQEIFVSPISRYSIILGKILGESLVSCFQLLGIITFALVIGVPFQWDGIGKILLIAPIITLFGGAFGIIVMSNLKDQRSANQIFPFLIFPQFFLAGIFSPIKILPLPLMILSRLAPMTYAVDLVRNVYYAGNSESVYTTIFHPLVSLSVVLTLSVIFIVIGTYLFIRNETNR